MPDTNNTPALPSPLPRTGYYVTYPPQYNGPVTLYTKLVAHHTTQADADADALTRGVACDHRHHWGTAAAADLNLR